MIGGPHLFMQEHMQGPLTNPPNTHLRIPKQKKTAPKTKDAYEAAEYLWYDRTYPISLPEQNRWRMLHL